MMKTVTQMLNCKKIAKVVLTMITKTLYVNLIHFYS